MLSRLLVATGFYGYHRLPRQEASRTVESFYDAEQTGDYNSAWELLHSSMKKKFGQEDYVKMRTDLFMGTLGISSFTYKIKGIDHLDRWRMSASSPYLKDVYRITVSQTFKGGVYGAASLYKPVYVTKENNHWTILWKY